MLDCAKLWELGLDRHQANCPHSEISEAGALFRVSLAYPDLHHLMGLKDAGSADTVLLLTSTAH